MKTRSRGTGYVRGTGRARAVVLAELAAATFVTMLAAGGTSVALSPAGHLESAAAASAGVGWTVQSLAPVSFDTIACPTATTCIAVGNEMVVTTSSGLLWTQQPLPASIGVNSIICLSVTQCWVAGSGPGGGGIAFTSDLGKTWTGATLPSGTTSIEQISCVPAGSSADCWGVTGTGTIIASTDGGITWLTQTTPPHTTMLDTISCSSTTDCWAGGTYQIQSPRSSTAVLVSTTNGGETVNGVSGWTAETLPEPPGSQGQTVLAQTVNRIACAAGSTACVASVTGPGSNYGSSYNSAPQVFYTSNGSTWSLSSFAPNGPSLDATCPSTTACFMAGGTFPSSVQGASPGPIAYSSDGGSTWSSQSVAWAGPVDPNSVSAQAISCSSTTDCYFAGAAGTQSGSSGFLASTTNGGTGWYQQQTYPLSSTLNGITCTSNQDCLVAGGRNGATISATTNGGTTWSALEPDICDPDPGAPSAPPPETSCVPNASPPQVRIYDYAAIACPTAQECLTVGGDANNLAEIDLTESAGQPVSGASGWSLETAPGGTSNLTAVACPSAADCWATDSAGHIIYTGNATAKNADGSSAASWIDDTVPAGIQNLDTIACPSTNDCWAGGTWGSGALLVATGNGGASWQPQTLPSQASAPITSIACPSTTECYVVDHGGNIFVTTDSGAAWTAESSQPSGVNYYTAITCISATECWAVGNGQRGAAISVTTNGGSTWESEIAPPGTGTPTAIDCADTNDCWYLSNGNIVYTTNGGFDAVPIVGSLSPTMGITTGGTQVTVTGQNFVGVSAVDLGTTPATRFTVDSPTQITAWTPASPTAAQVNVTVTNDGGTSATSSSDEFQYVSSAPKPDVLSAIPDSGPMTGGTEVTIDGFNLSEATMVSFGPTPSPSFTVNQAGTAITATSPASSAGTVDVTVTTAGGGTSVTNGTDGFTFIDPDTGFAAVSPPLRICDTRAGNQTQCSGGTIGGYGTLTVNVESQSGLPSSGMEAVMANVTVTNPTANGFLTVYPSGTGAYSQESSPQASTVNFSKGETVANLSDVEIGTGGNVSVYNGSGGSVDVILDVDGYVADTSATGAAGAYTPISPTRICDTRPGNPSGLSGGATQCNTKTLAAKAPMPIQVTGLAGVPSGATAVVLNVTMAGPSGPGFLTVYPSGSTPPTSSNVNASKGEVVPNRVVTGLDSTNGTFEVYSNVATDVIVDVSGYYTSPGSGIFMPEAPVRIVDTRCAATPKPSWCANEDIPQQNASQGALGSGQTVTFQVGGAGNVPLTATAVVANVTVTGSTAPSFLTIYPGGPLPTVSDLNWTTGMTVPNLVVVKLSGSGTISVYNRSGSTQVLVDVVGWYQ